MACSVQSRNSILGALLTVGMSLSVLGCGGRATEAEGKQTRAVRAVVATPAATPAVAPVAVTSLAALPASVAANVAPSAPKVTEPPLSRANASSLVVKRFVVTTGVKDREPVQSEQALPSDGAPIYAFAELQNTDGDTENVRVTFERKGSAERVGNVSLPVPAKVTRHRTWATTRYIRAAGVWEAVLWSESGTELSRTSFEVADS